MGDMIRCPKCATHHYTNDPCPDDIDTDVILSEIDELLDDDEPQTPADEFRQKLNRLLDEYVYSDSYGVYGSDFLTCTCCGAGGAPGVVFEHKPDCWAGKVEAIIYGSQADE
jgi:hypothetical protein